MCSGCAVCHVPWILFWHFFIWDWFSALFVIQFFIGNLPHYRCCVGGCNKDNWYPQKYVIRNYVHQLQNGQLKFHYMTRDTEKRKIWEKNISKGRDFEAKDHHVVCQMKQGHVQQGLSCFLSSTFLFSLNRTATGQRSTRENLQNP